MEKTDKYLFVLVGSLKKANVPDNNKILMLRIDFGSVGDSPFFLQQFVIESNLWNKQALNAAGISVKAIGTDVGQYLLAITDGQFGIRLANISVI